MSTAIATAISATEWVPEFLGELVLSADEQSATTANGAAPILRVIPNAPTPIVATRRDGTTYPGDLVADVVSYRELRARSLAGERLVSAELDMLSALESGLRQPREGVEGGEAALRSFFRFSCDFPARVRAGIVDGTFAVKDISAGGVKCEGKHRFTPGDVAYLVVERGDKSLQFPGRVAWVKDDVFGIMFAGAARFE